MFLANGGGYGDSQSIDILGNEITLEEEVYMDEDGSENRCASYSVRNAEDRDKIVEALQAMTF